MLKRLKNIIYKILRKSEKFTKTDMVYLARGSFWLTLTNGVMMLNAFLIAVAFANLLPQEVYGEYKYILAIFTLLNVFSMPGISTAVNRAVAIGYEGTVIAGMKTQVAWGIVGSLISAAIGGYYFIQGNAHLGVSILVLAIFIPLFDPTGIYRPYLNGKKYFDKSAKYAIPIEITTTAILILTLFLTDELFYILLAYFVPYILMRAGYLIFILKKYKPNDRIDKESISLGKHLTLISVLSQIANQMDKMVLWHFLGPVSLAIYSFAMALPEQIKVGIKELRALALPKFSAQDPEILRKTLAPKIFKAMLLLIPVVLLYIVAAPWIFNTFFPQYTDSILYSQIYAISIIFTPQTILTTYLQSKAKKKPLYFINIGRPIIKITLLVILIPLYGIMGAILSIIITRTIGTIGYFVYSKKL